MSLTNVAPNDCPEPPGFKASLSTLILHEACQTAGSIGNLAQLLGVSTLCLERWLDGYEEVPRDIYHACIDIVLLHETDANPAPVKPKIHTR